MRDPQIVYFVVGIHNGFQFLNNFFLLKTNMFSIMALYYKNKFHKIDNKTKS